MRTVFVFAARLVVLASLLAAPLALAAPPDPLDHWRSPRLRVETDSWKGFQIEGVSLDAGTYGELTIPSGETVTFSWSARPKTGKASILGYRWTLDIADFHDETPRFGPGDLAHWSVWSATETSATVGPFAPGSEHLFYVETRDDLGFITLAVVRIVVAA